jgi:hypothetical protein
MKKIILTLLLGMFLISFVSAPIQTLGTFKVGEEINLMQICASCSYNNITSVLSPSSRELIRNSPMVADGSKYNFTLLGGNTTAAGEYIVNGIGDLDGTDTVWNYNFFITPSGFSDTFDFYIIILLIAGVMIVFGFWIKDPWIVIFGTFGLYFVGLYIMLNGIVGIKDMVTTWAIALIILGVAGYISVKSALEVMNG